MVSGAPKSYTATNSWPLRDSPETWLVYHRRSSRMSPSHTSNWDRDVNDDHGDGAQGSSPQPINHSHDFHSVHWHRFRRSEQSVLGEFLSIHSADQLRHLLLLGCCWACGDDVVDLMQKSQQPHGYLIVQFQALIDSLWMRTMNRNGPQMDHQMSCSKVRQSFNR